MQYNRVVKNQEGIKKQLMNHLGGKRLQKGILLLALLGVALFCAGATWGKEPLDRVDFSDKHYLLPVDLSVVENRADESRFTEMGYEDSTLRVSISEGRFEDKCDYWVADVQIVDPSQLRTASSSGSFLRSAQMDGVKLCDLVHAVVGLNGDYTFGLEKLDYHYTVRQGELYWDNLDNKTIPISTWRMDLLLIDEDGDFHVVHQARVGDVTDMRIEGKRIMNSFSFGPALVLDGQMVEDFEETDLWLNMSRDQSRQRMAICQAGPLHYKIVCCSGPYVNAQKGTKSTGLTLKELAQLVSEQEVQIGYNLDGGDSTLLYFHGRRINLKPISSTRKLQDVIYFVSAEGL